MCVCVDGMNLKYAQRWHIHIYQFIPYMRILKPFEDSKLTGLKVDIADAAYSNSGRMKTLYAFSLMLEALIFKLCLRKPRALFALEQVLLMWSSQLTVLFIVTPRYLADETFSRVCPWRT